MGCFLACFGGAKDRKRRRPANKSPPVDRVVSESYKPLRSPSSKQLIPNLSPKKLVSEAVVGSTPESRDDREQGSCGSSKKKVTFDLNVKTYEEVLIDEDPKHLAEDKKEDDEVTKEERKHEQGDDESLPKSGASLLNHRYRNCEDDDDDDDDDMDYGEEEEEEEDYEYSDLDEQDNNVVEIEGNEEESNASFLLLAMEKEQQCIQEVDSPKSKCVSPPDRQPSLLARGGGIRDRSRYVHPVLNPVENLTQWREVKVRAAPSKNQKKENINSDAENKRTFSSEHTLEVEKFQKLSSSNPRPNCPAKHDIPVDASLSNWLVSLDNSDKERPQQSNSHLSKLSVGQEEQSISGAQSSAMSSPRRSPSRSPEEIPIAGAAGSCWSCKNQRSDSGSSCHSVSTIKRIPNTTGTYREALQVLENDSFKYEM